MSDDLSPEEQAIYDAELAVAEKLVEKAMAPYRKFLSAKQLEEMREDLIDVLMTHPNAGDLIAHLAKRAAPNASGEVGPGAAADDGSKERSGAK
jgi:hypothetical protein